MSRTPAPMRPTHADLRPRPRGSDRHARGDVLPQQAHRRRGADRRTPRCPRCRTGAVHPNVRTAIRGGQQPDRCGCWTTTPYRRRPFSTAPFAERNARVGIVAAGTSDRSVALEAQRTLQFLGISSARLHIDVGVAGLWRLLDRVDELRSEQALIVVAGMDAALASVVGGLVACPVIARADVDRLRCRPRRSDGAQRHAGKLCARRAGDQHRQRVRRCVRGGANRVGRQMTSTLYLDCVGGVAGDMLLSALIDAGASLDAIRSRLPVSDVGLDVHAVQRHGIAALGTERGVAA